MPKWQYCAVVNIDRAFDPRISDLTEALRSEALKAGKNISSLLDMNEQAQWAANFMDQQKDAELWWFTKGGVTIAEQKFSGIQQVSSLIAQLGAAGWEMAGHVNNMLFFKRPIEEKDKELSGPGSGQTF